MNGNECIEEYAIRRNRIGYYFCTECKHNHKVDSKKGIEHIGNDILYDVIIKKDTANVWELRHNALKENRKLKFPKNIDVITKPQTDNSRDLYAQFKENQKSFLRAKSLYA